MSCQLYNPASFTSHVIGTDYAVGDIRKDGSSVYLCLSTDINSQSIGDNPNWMNTRDIVYNLTSEPWAASDNVYYHRFTVVENAGTLYMCVKSHENAGSEEELTALVYWTIVNTDCLLGEKYPYPNKNYEVGGSFSVGDVVEYEDGYYAFLYRDAIANETPGETSSILAGKQWENITEVAQGPVDLYADNTENIYSPTTTYLKEDKFRHTDGYYVSTHDNNYNRIPGETDSWQLAHLLGPQLEIDGAPEEWVAGSYNWGDAVTYQGKTYLSLVYENAETPGTNENKWETYSEKEIVDCSTVLAMYLYNPTFPYSANDGVEFNGNSYVSRINNNTKPLTDTSAWLLCAENVEELCENYSLGIWNGENWYPKGSVVEWNGTFYKANAGNTDSFPLNSYLWTVCKGNPDAPCGDINTALWDSQTSYSAQDKARHNNAIWVAKVDNTNVEPAILGSTWYFCRQLGYVITPINDTYTHETLVYNEALEAFDQFIDMNACLYLEVNGKVYSFNEAKKMFIHQGGEPGAFHDSTPKTMVIKVVVNDSAQLRKYFDHIRALTETGNIKFDNVTVRTNFTPSQVINKDDHTYKIREGIHTMPARGLADVSRLIGNWMEVTYKITGTEGDPIEFRFVSSDYIYRMSNRL